jgi:magnesium chelatase family protein
MKGALSFAILAKKMGFKEIILPRQNAREALLIDEIKIIPIETLTDALAYLVNKKQFSLESRRAKMKN